MPEGWIDREIMTASMIRRRGESSVEWCGQRRGEEGGKPGEEGSTSAKGERTGEGAKGKGEGEKEEL